jgi:hypothetical protein
LINTAVRTWLQSEKNRGCTLPAPKPKIEPRKEHQLNSKLIAAVLIASATLIYTTAPIAAQSPPESSITRPYPEMIKPGLSHMDGAEIPDLAEFAKIVTNGRADQITGVYAPGVGHYSVVQQASDNDIHVSPVGGVLTQYHRPAAGGVIGLLAHNFAAGAGFDRFQPGDRVYLIYGDGAIQNYRLTGTLRYQAADPDNAYTDLIDLADGRVQSADTVYRRVYTGTPHLVLQTCLEGNGDLNWGRLFLLAEKIEQEN